MKTCKMNNPFYLLQGTIFRTQENLNDLIEINEVFSNESLIVARRNAFRKYQSYVDVFLDSIGSKYKTYNDAIQKLQDFVNSYRVEYAANNPDLEQVDVDFDKGLFIYLVIDPSDTYRTKEGELIYNKKVLIHFFNADFENYWKAALQGLQVETDFYLTNKFDASNELQLIKHTAGNSYSIFFSPINYQKIIDNEFGKTIKK